MTETEWKASWGLVWEVWVDGGRWRARVTGKDVPGLMVVDGREIRYWHGGRNGREVGGWHMYIFCICRGLSFSFSLGTRAAR